MSKETSLLVEDINEAIFQQVGDEESLKYAMMRAMDTLDLQIELDRAGALSEKTWLESEASN